MGRKLALVIGNSEYTDPRLAQLKTPEADVCALAELLRAREIGDFNDVRCLTNPSFAEAQPAVAEFFADKHPDDLLLFYFSGHGVLDDMQNRLYLALKDTRCSYLRGTALASQFVKEEMDCSRARQQVLMLDCCHSGAFARGAKAVLGAPAVTPETFEGRGRVVLTATDITQYAWEGDQVLGETANSLFTHFVVEGLKTGAADLDNDGWVTPDELYEYVFEQVLRATPRQKPRKIVYDQQGQIRLAHNPYPIMAALPPELQTAIESPFVNIRVGAVEELARLLHSGNPALAFTVRLTLGKLATDDSRRVSETATRALEDQKEAGKKKEETAAPARTVSRQAPVKLKSWLRRWGAIGAGILFLGILVIFGGKAVADSAARKAVTRTVQADSTQTAQAIAALPTQTPTATSTLPPSGTPTPTQYPSSTPTPKPPTAIPPPGIGTTQIYTDGMTGMYVPAGKFLMGSTAVDVTQAPQGCSDCDYHDEIPQHTVYLDAFWIDQTEVTNAMYAKCVNDGKCQPPSQTRSSSRAHYYDNPTFGNYPVIYVSWNDAMAYCEWAGRRLPTEAQWEKAARGIQGYQYPWGNDSPNSSLLNANMLWGDTTEVGHFPAGASPYGALDMAGNVWEWVADWYDENYYATAPSQNPVGPLDETYRVGRGGSWEDGMHRARAAARDMDSPGRRDKKSGFRCARSP